MSPNQKSAQQIRDLISEIEEQYHIEILLASEMGSRAWGLEGPASDFDVRFIYREAPEKAFALFPESDAMRVNTFIMEGEKETETDLVGWSLPKALKLAAASNPQIGEICRAPIQYQRDPSFTVDLMNLSKAGSTRVMAHYHRGIAKKNLLSKICDAPLRDVKVHLQMLRGFMSAIWFTQNPEQGGFPPLDFDELRASVHLSNRHQWLQGTDEEIDQLLKLKRSGAPRKTHEIFPLVQQWALVEMERLDKEVLSIPNTEFDKELVEAVFRSQYPETFSNEESPAPPICRYLTGGGTQQASPWFRLETLRSDKIDHGAC